jgi:ABC-2 type transport system permease protein
MNYFNQLKTVTLWEYKRFYKLKNELIGIVVLLVLFSLGFFGGEYIAKSLGDKQAIALPETTDPQLLEILDKAYDTHIVSADSIEAVKEQIELNKKGMLLEYVSETGFVLFAYKKPGKMDKLQESLDEYEKIRNLSNRNLTMDDLDEILQPADIQTQYIYDQSKGKKRIVALFFAGIMVMAVFVSFAYQFTAITGEKQLKITEQIVSAIKPQIWMDGKILGITLTGLSSMITYTIVSILGGMLLFLFTGASVAQIQEYINIKALAIYFPFTIMGILLWNAMMAAVASIITDPNNSGKSSLMMLPVLFVIASTIVLAEPDNHVAVFLSWFPLTSATGMPMRWIATEIFWWEIIGSFIVLVGAFYLVRKLAATIFRVSILISGKEPTWAEVIKLAREK